MTVCTEEKTTLEKHLCFVLGRTVDLRSSELLSLSAADLKRAYYRRAHELHPDKAAGLGLNPDYLTERFRNLQDSYDFLLESLDSGLFTRYAGKRDPVIFRSRQDYRTRPETASPSSKGPRTGRTARSDDSAAGPRPFSRASTSTGASASSSARPFTSASSSVPAVSGWFAGTSIPGFPLRLAQFLYYSRKIDTNTLIKALSWQYRVRPKLGDLAISLGYMTAHDVLFVIRQKKPSELFGETALRLGFLTPYRFSVLMGRQRLLNLPIGRFFVDEGYLSPGELAIALAELNAHNYRVKATSRSHAPGCFAK
jgi:hypothetical protein